MQTEINSLLQRLKSACEAYYNTGVPVMSDHEYDAARDELEQLDPENSFLAQVGAPVPAGKKVKHLVPMLSLRKATTGSELSKWYDKIIAAIPVGYPPQPLSPLALAEAVIQPKIDGSSLELQYKDGQLMFAVTRGDGVEGEDVTPNALLIPSIPNIITGFTGAVKGEIILTQANYAIVDPEMDTNARNVGNGVLRRQSDTTQAHLLNFIAYGCDGDHVCELAAVEWLKVSGFTTPMTLIANGFEAVTKQVEEIRTQRGSFEYDIDGAVVRANCLAVHAALGVSSGRPHAQIAYKWPSQTTVTTIKGVTLTVGHTGLISPTAILEPVQLGGVTVSNALLNNWGEIGRLGVHIGDEVEIIRTGEIIPKIIKVAKPGANRQPIVEPTTCPCCGGKAGRALNPTGTVAAVTTCWNEDTCPAQLTGRVKRWIKSLDILGIGDELLAELTAPGGIVKTPLDLYGLTEGVLAGLKMGKGTVGASRAKTIVENIQGRKTITIDQFFGSLGIPHLGKRRVEIVRKDVNGALNTVDAWMDESTLRPLLTAVLPAQSKDVLSWFRKDDNLALVVRAAEILTITTPGNKPVKPTQIEGYAAVITGNTPPKKVYTFVLTGKFEVQKSVYKKEIEAAGHVFAEDITGETTHLVQADKNSESNKTKKAKSKGIAVIDVVEMYDLING